jgi:hypothetical protein
MKVWDFIKPFWTWIVGALVIASAFLTYQHLQGIATRSEIQSQVLKAQINAIQEQNKVIKKEAEASDLKALSLAKTSEEANQKALSEHAKSEALKKKLADLLALHPVDPSGGGLGTGDDPIALRDEIITQQENEIQSLNGLIENKNEEIKTLVLSRDSWKLYASKSDEQIALYQKQVRALELGRDAAQRAGVLREGRGMLEGGAIVFVAHLLGAF